MENLIEGKQQILEVAKALMLRDSLQLATKYCKILVEQVDYLKVAANKDGNKRIEQIASEAKENLLSQVQKKLRYASALFNSQIDISASDSASTGTSSLEGSPTDRSPVSSLPSIVRSRITANELKEAAENLKKQKGIPMLWLKLPMPEILSIGYWQC